MPTANPRTIFIPINLRVTTTLNYAKSVLYPLYIPSTLNQLHASPNDGSFTCIPIVAPITYTHIIDNPKQLPLCICTYTSRVIPFFCRRRPRSPLIPTTNHYVDGAICKVLEWFFCTELFFLRKDSEFFSEFCSRKCLRGGVKV